LARIGRIEDFQIIGMPPILAALRIEPLRQPLDCSLQFLLATAAPEAALAIPKPDVDAWTYEALKADVRVPHPLNNVPIEWILVTLFNACTGFFALDDVDQAKCRVSYYASKGKWNDRSRVAGNYLFIGGLQTKDQRPKCTCRAFAR